MPALDNCQPSVIRALEKSGWFIENAPFRLKMEQRVYYIDLKASQQHNGTKLTVLFAEIKCFGSGSVISQEIYGAFGQYLIYRSALKTENIAIPLYLVIPKFTYELYFDAVVQLAIRENRIKLLVIDMDTESVHQWIE
jgi:hypothetical protein